MDRPALMAITVAFLAVLLLLMYLGWRSRQRRQSALASPRQVPDDTGVELLRAEVFYVATTVADEPLNRIAVRGLGYRARATVTLAERGVVLEIPGQDAIFIPVEDIRAVERASWTIDRVVEEGGMVRIRWTLGSAVLGSAVLDSAVLDSYLRVIDPAVAAEFLAVATSLLGHTSSTGGRS